VHGPACRDANRNIRASIRPLMPGMNGAELVEKATAKYPQLPIIVATDYADMKAIDAVIGNNTVLRKPSQMGELVESVKVALAQ
jgi:DNA-binding NtrC family response regulator